MAGISTVILAPFAVAFKPGRNRRDPGAAAVIAGLQRSPTTPELVPLAVLGASDPRGPRYARSVPGTLPLGAEPPGYWCRSQTPKFWPPLLSPDGLATTVLAGVPSLVLMRVLVCHGPMTVPCAPS